MDVRWVGFFPPNKNSLNWLKTEVRQLLGYLPFTFKLHGDSLFHNAYESIEQHILDIYAREQQS
jgi:hypothetical protein